MRRDRLFFVFLASVLAGGVMWAQVGRGTTEWLTAQGDAQRTSWVRTDPAISLETMSKPGFELQWKSKLDNASRAGAGLFSGVTANGVTLFVPMSIITGSSNNVYGLDNDTGYVVWQRRFEGTLAAATPACAGGITAAATRIVPVAQPPIPAPRAGGAGRGGAGYRSLLGQPGEGVPVEARGGGAGRGGAAAPAPARGGDPASPPAAAPARGGDAATPPASGAAGPGRGVVAPARGGGGAGAPAGSGIPGAGNLAGGGGLGRPSGVVYAVSSDGQLRVLGLPSGKDIQKPAAFLPANAQWTDAIAVGTTLYAATTGACGAPAGVWAIDLDSPAKPVVSWKTSGGGIVGNLAFMSDGTVLAALGAGTAGPGGYANAIVALDAKTLQVKDWYTQPAAEFVTGPTVLRVNEKDVVAAATKDGRVLLLDASSLGGSSHNAPMAASKVLLGAGARIATSALATWQEATFAEGAATATMGANWLLVPIAGRPAADVTATNGAMTGGAVVALKVSGTTIEAGWTSANLTAPATPITVNGVVFALASGSASSPAVLHAYDGKTGKPLWNSGRAIAGAASGRSFWSALSQLYVGANDGTVYAFGFLDERR